MKRWIYFLPVGALAAALLLFSGYALTRKTAQVLPDAMVGKPLPSIFLAPLEGGAPTDLSTLHGPALVNVFASWCVPCAVEHPQLMRVRKQGVIVIGVAYKDQPSHTLAFLERLGDPFVSVMSDPKGAAGIELGISGVPETFAVNAKGIIVAKHSGPMTTADADRLTDALKVAR